MERRKGRTLIVEDSPEVMKLFDMYYRLELLGEDSMDEPEDPAEDLRSLGVGVARTYNSARAFVSSTGFDFVLLDDELPNRLGDSPSPVGYDLIQTIRQMNSETTIIGTSSRPYVEKGGMKLDYQLSKTDPSFGLKWKEICSQRSKSKKKPLQDLVRALAPLAKGGPCSLDVDLTQYYDNPVEFSHGHGFNWGQVSGGSAKLSVSGNTIYVGDRSYENIVSSPWPERVHIIPENTYGMHQEQLIIGGLLNPRVDADVIGGNSGGLALRQGRFGNSGRIYIDGDELDV